MMPRSASSYRSTVLRIIGRVTLQNLLVVHRSACCRRAASITPIHPTCDSRIEASALSWSSITSRRSIRALRMVDDATSRQSILDGGDFKKSHTRIVGTAVDWTVFAFIVAAMVRNALPFPGGIS
jgi:hypothetical protein